MRSDILVRTCKALRRYTNDVEIYAVDSDAAPYNRRIARKFASPEVVTQNHCGIATRHLPLLRQQSASQRRLNAEHLKIVIAHHYAGSQLRVLGGGFC